MTNFIIEAWTYLAIDLIVVFIRCFAQWWNKGFRGLAMDDYLMVVAVLLYTAETATAHYVGAYWFGLANSGMTPEMRASLDPHSLEYHLRVKGSQTQLFGWLVYTVLLWVLKTCWLCFYLRLGDGVSNMQLKVKVGFAFVFVTFFATFFTILCGCWPISKHWQIYPDPGNFCYPAVSRLQAWTLITTNIVTDLYIMSIPLPMVWNAHISVGKKLALMAMFCGGILTTVAGILRCTFVLLDRPDGPQQAGEWSCRESFIAVFVSNIPILYPIVFRFFKHVSGLTTGLSHGRTSEGTENKSYKLSTLSRASRKKKFKHPLSLPGETFYERYGSEEEIVKSQQLNQIQEEGEEKDKSKILSAPLDDITVTTTFRVQSQEAGSGPGKK
ncbi:hypothetical protein GQ43DRAFT_450569 [Delitschia confertaspora ATCC 74209]|uniref:Rhodopsin domain-containing protein n=1 Tax=Delitschia confertaspora ATCC 74209 TaxID=1513339 RepID=A0A9P4MQK1_9PLEO|nr:hypothetical protein GQ43DRAFT_450569 [Delitschia confertaspora ATCC 74209]